jgi:diguanylate cyclase (GGDEF)-like protein
LEHLLALARNNELKLKRFGELERLLMTTRVLSQLVMIMLVDFRRYFDLDEVNLVLLDATGDWLNTLGVPQAAELSALGLTLVDGEHTLYQRYAEDFRPYLGKYNEDSHPDCFSKTGLASIALIPLARQGNLYGGLHLASRDPERFQADDGTYFLERLASFLLMCLENSQYFDKLERFGLTDALTQVNNRRYFDARLKEAVSHALRHRQPLMAMMFDLDHFKQVNDQHGHQSGDSVLQQAAILIQECLRASDSFARYGGEEFVALLPGTDTPAAIEIAERIRSRIAEHEFTVSSTISLKLSVSIGVSKVQLDDIDELAAEQNLVHEADAALYLAKQQGRNCVVAA